MAKREVRCEGCNKLLMRDDSIKCPRCKEVVMVGTPCEFYENCSHRLENKRLTTITSLINTLPIAMKEKMRFSSYGTQRMR